MTICNRLKRGQRWKRLVDNERFIVYEILHIFVDLHGKQKLVIQMVPKPPKQIGNLYFRQGGKYPPRIVSPAYLCSFSLIEEVSLCARSSSL